MRPLQQEKCAQVLKPSPCFEQSPLYAMDLKAKPPMREGWSSCWWIARAHEWPDRTSAKREAEYGGMR